MAQERGVDMNYKLSKANLLNVKLCKFTFPFIYSRFSNASNLCFLWFDITWRMKWLNRSIYLNGYDDGFREGLSARNKKEGLI